MMLDSTHAGVPLLEVDGLTVEFRQGGRWTPVAEDVSFSVRQGETVGLVGESGSGKTVTSLAIMGLIDSQGGRIARGSIRLAGEELVGLPTRRMRRLRGASLSMVFQQAIRSLNPSMRVGEQIAEAVRLHQGASRADAWKRAVYLLDRVGIPDAARRAREYPHQFSGGMCQRVMIAMALSCDPAFLIADEPTTALDVTVQRTILDLLAEIQEETGVALLFISHDLGTIAEMADRVLVMYAGQVVERASVVDLFRAPRHPYTQGLLECIPRGRGERLVAIPGTVPTPGSILEGCRFAPRCAHATPGLCDLGSIELVETDEFSANRCVRADELRIVTTGVS